MSEIIQITKENLSDVVSLLNERKGYVLAEGNCSGGIIRSLYSNPKLEGQFLLAQKSEENRNYMLREIPRPTSNASWDCAREFFERLNIGKYELKIGPEYSSGFAPAYAKNTLFVPSREDLGEIISNLLVSDLDNQLSLWKQSSGITKEQIKQLRDYISEDLNTGRVLNHNRKAGMDADAMVGF